MTTTIKTYNGYANYPTWAISLWIDNDEYLNDWLAELANNDRLSLSEKADQLKDNVEEWQDALFPDLNQRPGMFTDLLGFALGLVDWREIIEAHQEED